MEGIIVDYHRVERTQRELIAQPLIVDPVDGKGVITHLRCWMLAYYKSSNCCHLYPCVMGRGYNRGEGQSDAMSTCGSQLGAATLFLWGS